MKLLWVGRNLCGKSAAFATLGNSAADKEDCSKHTHKVMLM
ncbi:hypothetical protein [Pleurocapsa sp. CCALA 161]|nr:hypothetical protein [Pleurocapsa sp. CCALA 161]